ncbi:hypothetical protein HG263_07340 [Pseudoalteromonas sp. JBTF-M23]|uniref:Uncharacterized protein n=1 Tax=Pseudoalteromonas caenipelagi TaxID=2726988 RepID=A0A849VBG8_9GAMM|nr:hypothetical protein [Pseudoalteromonas caenipelagi]NOU50355.1 hypothetical protein [Pseudoalteromonas caenipelagi]
MFDIKTAKKIISLCSKNGKSSMFDIYVNHDFTTAEIAKFSFYRKYLPNNFFNGIKNHREIKDDLTNRATGQIDGIERFEIAETGRHFKSIGGSYFTYLEPLKSYPLGELAKYTRLEGKEIVPFYKLAENLKWVPEKGQSPASIYIASINEPIKVIDFSANNPETLQVAESFLSFIHQHDPSVFPNRNAKELLLNKSDTTFVKALSNVLFNFTEVDAVLLSSVQDPDVSNLVVRTNAEGEPVVNVQLESQMTILKDSSGVFKAFFTNNDISENSNVKATNGEIVPYADFFNPHQDYFGYSLIDDLIKMDKDAQTVVKYKDFIDLGSVSPDILKIVNDATKEEVRTLKSPFSKSISEIKAAVMSTKTNEKVLSTLSKKSVLAVTQLARNDTNLKEALKGLSPIGTSAVIQGSIASKVYSELGGNTPADNNSFMQLAIEQSIIQLRERYRQTNISDLIKEVAKSAENQKVTADEIKANIDELSSVESKLKDVSKLTQEHEAKLLEQKEALESKKRELREKQKREIEVSKELKTDGSEYKEKIKDLELKIIEKRKEIFHEKPKLNTMTSNAASMNKNFVKETSWRLGESACEVIFENVIERAKDIVLAHFNRMYKKNKLANVFQTSFNTKIPHLDCFAQISFYIILKEPTITNICEKLNSFTLELSLAPESNFSIYSENNPELNRTESVNDKHSTFKLVIPIYKTLSDLKNNSSDSIESSKVRVKFYNKLLNLTLSPEKGTFFQLCMEGEETHSIWGHYLLPKLAEFFFTKINHRIQPKKSFDLRELIFRNNFPSSTCNFNLSDWEVSVKEVEEFFIHRLQIKNCDESNINSQPQERKFVSRKVGINSGYGVTISNNEQTSLPVLELNELIEEMKGVNTTDKWDLAISYDAATLTAILKEKYSEGKLIEEINLSTSSKLFGRTIKADYTLHLESPTIVFDGADLKSLEMSMVIKDKSKIEVFQDNDTSPSITNIEGDKYKLVANVPLAVLRGTTGKVEPSDTVIVFDEDKEVSDHVILHFENSNKVQFRFEAIDPHDTSEDSNIDELNYLGPKLANYFSTKIKEIDLALAQVNNQQEKEGTSLIKPQEFVIDAIGTPEHGVLTIYMRADKGTANGARYPAFKPKDSRVSPIPKGHKASLIISNDFTKSHLLEPAISKEGFHVEFRNTAGTGGIQAKLSKATDVIRYPGDRSKSGVWSTDKYEFEAAAINLSDFPICFTIGNGCLSVNWHGTCHSNWRESHEHLYDPHRGNDNNHGRVIINADLHYPTTKLTAENQSITIPPLKFGEQYVNISFVPDGEEACCLKDWLTTVPSYYKDVKIDIPTIEISFGSFDFFLSSNVLSPGQNLFNLSKADGVNIPYDMLMVGELIQAPTKG